MKKNTAIYIALLLIPLMVVGIAISPNSVTVIRGEELTYTTFAEAVSGSYVGWCAPVALLATYALFAMAVIYGITKKQYWLKGIRGVSFVAACLVACPVLVQGGEVMVVPNVLAAILLLGLWLAAHMALKNKDLQKTEAPTGRRLGGK